MSAANLNERKRELIEKIGVFHEKFGFQPVAARIYGLLLVSDKSELTFDEIREELQVSKSAVSTALNLLLTMKQIDYITKPGERKRYFRSNLCKWQSFLGSLMEIATNYAALFKEVKEVRNNDASEMNQYINEITSFIDYITNSFPKIITDWAKSD